MKERKLLIIAGLLVAVTIGLLALDCGSFPRQVQGSADENVLLIDPGHGGMDGGAVAGDGTAEKDINLAIAVHLANLAEKSGWKVIMTRETDQWLCETEDGSIRSRKTEDLKNRCQMIEKYSPDIVISIHLNSFKEDTSVRGSQVFYPASQAVSENDNDNSVAQTEPVLQQCKELAELIQKNLIEYQTQQKERTAMSRDGVFIFREVACPTVIVECGFLSNPEELELLKNVEYQQRTAEGILAGVTEFTGFEKSSELKIIDSLR